jgi:hypothetical protein
MLSVIAMPIITTLVPSSAPAWDSSGIRRRNGGDGMICSQNSTPVPNRVACISQMCTAWFSSARSKRPGRCHRSIAALNSATDTHGRSSRPPSPRSGRDQPPASTPRVMLRPVRRGSASISGCHGAPATISDGAANISSRCWIMCAKK